MKKQIFSLMLSAAIFTTSPLFAMETTEFQDERSGLPHILRKEPSLTPLILDEVETVCRFSCTSTMMNSMCQSRDVWDRLSKKLPITISISDGTKEIKNQIQIFYKYFTDQTQKYPVTMKMLDFLKQHLNPEKDNTRQPFFYSSTIGFHTYDVMMYDVPKISFCLFDINPVIFSPMGELCSANFITFSNKEGTAVMIFDEAESSSLLDETERNSAYSSGFQECKQKLLKTTSEQDCKFLRSIIQIQKRKANG